MIGEMTGDGGNGVISPLGSNDLNFTSEVKCPYDGGKGVISPLRSNDLPLLIPQNQTA